MSILTELGKSRLKYLVVEPVEEMRNLLKAYLAPIEGKTILASNERDGFKLVKSERPDLIVAACGFHEVGADLCCLVRQEPELAETLFVITTTSSDPKIHYEFFEKGSDQIVMKPFRSKDLYAAIKAALVGRKSRQQAKIHVLYKEGGFDFVDAGCLDQLIARQEIVCFRRSSGVALIGRDPVRATSRSGYEGRERRGLCTV